MMRSSGPVADWRKALALLPNLHSQPGQFVATPSTENPLSRTFQTILPHVTGTPKSPACYTEYTLHSTAQAERYRAVYLSVCWPNTMNADNYTSTGETARQRAVVGSAYVFRVIGVITFLMGAASKSSLG